MSIKTNTNSSDGPAFFDQFAAYSNWSTQETKLGTESRLAASRPQPRYQGADTIAFYPGLTAPSTAPFSGDRGALKAEMKRSESTIKLAAVAGSIILILLYFKLSKY